MVIYKQNPKTMDFTKIRCISESCKDKNIIMNGAGGTISSNITIAKVKCPICESTLMIIPIREDIEYNIQTKPTKP